ncbi:MAG: transporter, partial [Gemmatimonadetes bacterium]|nr:transporter [Gemmatimonadota bacterium]
PLVTDRPDFTESVAVVPRGRLQAEAGYTFTRTGAQEEHALGEILLRIPAAERLELRLGLNSFVWTRGPGGDAAGREDASLGMKLRLAEARPEAGVFGPGVAVLAALAVPTGSSALREENLQPEAKLALGFELSDRLGLSSNLNYAYASDAGRRFHQLSGSLSLGYAVAPRLGSYLEVFGFAPDGPDGSEMACLNGGFTWLLSPDLQLDARAGIGLNGARPDYFAGVGLARRW